MQLELRTGEAAQEVGSVKIALTRMSAADVELRINGKLYHVPYLGTYSWNGTDLTIQRNGTVSVFVTIPEGAFATAIV